MIAGHLEHGKVAHGAPLAQAALLIHHRLEEHRGVQLSLHQKVRLALHHKGHRLAGSLCQVGHIVDVLLGHHSTKLRQRRINQLLISHQHGDGNPLLTGLEHRFNGVGVPGGGHRHAGGAGLALGSGNQFIKAFVNHGWRSPLQVARRFVFAFYILQD